MKKDKDWFISQYNEIHNNLSVLENELEFHINNKERLINNEDIVLDLSNKIKKEIKRLEKTRKNERKIFNY